MTDFVEQCRREWKRLGVPTPLAEEMATDLETDLAEAKAEGISAEELLGASVFDPPSFAASWAAERGIIPTTPGRGDGRRRPVVLAVFTALAALTLVVAGVLLLTGEPKVSLVTSTTSTPDLHGLPGGGAVPRGPSGRVLSTSASAPIEWILLFLAIVALAFAGWLWSGWARSRRATVPAV